METLEITQAVPVMVEFDSDFDGVEVFIPYAGYVSSAGDYLATVNIWSGSWEVSDGYLTPAQEKQVDRQIKQFIKSVEYVH